MNVSKTTQLELALLLRSLKILMSTPGLSMVAFFEEMNQVLKGTSERSLSAYWKEKYAESGQKVDSLVAAEPGTREDSLVNIRELSYLNDKAHADAKHDPLLLVRTLFDIAVQSLASAGAEEQATLMLACTLLASKSARASLLLNTAVICCLLKDDFVSLDASVLSEYHRNCIEAARRDTAKAVVGDLQKQEAREALGGFHRSEEPETFVLSFGKADHGKLGHGDLQLNRLIPTVIEGLRGENVIKVVSMSTYALAITMNGLIYIWGTGGSVGAVASGRLSISPQILEAVPMSTPVKDISCGLGHTLFLTTKGQVWSWGNGGNGRLGLGDIFDRTEACIVSSLASENVVAVQCGASHSLVLTDKGQVYSWGKNSQGQCGHGNMDDVLKPTLIKKFVMSEAMTIVHVAAGWEHSLALTKGGKLYSWGCGYKDSRRGVIPPVLGLGHCECRPSPEVVSSIEGVMIVAVASGWDHCLALDSDGKLLSWGSGQNGKLGHGSEENISVPCYIPDLDQVQIRSISAGCEHSAAISVDGTLYAWGHGDGGRLGLGSCNPSLSPIKIDSISKMNLKTLYVHCGDKFTIAIATRDEEKDIQVLLDNKASRADLCHFPLRRSSLGWQMEGLWRDFSACYPPHPSSSSTGTPATTAMGEEGGSSAGDSVKAASLTGGASVNTSSPRDFVGARIRKRQQFFQNIVDSQATEPMLLRSMDVMTMLLHGMVVAGHTRLPLCAAAVRPRMEKKTASNDERKLLSDDFEYSIEIHEDVYVNTSALLELLSADYMKCLHLVANGVGSAMDDGGKDMGGESGKTGSEKSAERCATQFNDGLIQTCAAMRSQFEPLYAVLIVASLNFDALDLAMDAQSSFVESSEAGISAREDNAAVTEKLSLYPFISRREEMQPPSTHRNRGDASLRQRNNDAISYYSGEEDERSLGPHDDEDDTHSHRRIQKIRQRNHSYHSQYTNRDVLSMADDDDDVLSRGESTDFDYDNSLDESMSQEGSLLDQHEDSMSYAMSSLRTSHVGSVAIDGSLNATPSGGNVGPGFAQSTQDEDDDRNYERGNYGSRHSGPHDYHSSHPGSSAPGVAAATTATTAAEAEAAAAAVDSEYDNADSKSLSLAPSYESLENSASDGDRDLVSREANLEDSQAITYAGFSMLEEFSAAEQEDAPQADVDSVEFQHALLCSIEATQRMQNAKKYLRKIDHRRGQATIPIIRNQINTLASHCFLALRNVKTYCIPGYGTGEHSSKASAVLEADVVDVHQTFHSIYAIWEAAQIATATGMEILYDRSEQSTILGQIFQSPASFLYILPGIVGGLKRKGDIYGLLSSFFSAEHLFADEREDFEDEDEDLDGPRGERRRFGETNDQDQSLLRVGDILHILEHFQSLFQDHLEPVAIDRHSIPAFMQNTVQLMELMLQQVRAAFAELVGTLAALPIAHIRSIALSSANSFGGLFSVRTETTYAHARSVLLSVGSCIQLELQDLLASSPISSPSGEAELPSLPTQLPRDRLRVSFTRIVLDSMFRNLSYDAFLHPQQYSLIFSFTYHLFGFLSELYQQHAQTNGMLTLPENSYLLEWLNEQSRSLISMLARMVLMLCHPPRELYPLQDPYLSLLSIRREAHSVDGGALWKDLCERYLPSKAALWCKFSSVIITEGVAASPTESVHEKCTAAESGGLPASSLLAILSCLEDLKVLEGQPDTAEVSSCVDFGRALLSAIQTNAADEVLEVRLFTLVLEVEVMAVEPSLREQIGDLRQLAACLSMSAMAITYSLCTADTHPTAASLVEAVNFLQSLLLSASHVRPGCGKERSWWVEMRQAYPEWSWQQLWTEYSRWEAHSLHKSLDRLLFPPSTESSTTGVQFPFEASLEGVLLIGVFGRKDPSSSHHGIDYFLQSAVWREAVSISQESGMNLYRQVVERLWTFPWSLQDEFFTPSLNQLHQRFSSVCYTAYGSCNTLESRRDIMHSRFERSPNPPSLENGKLLAYLVRTAQELSAVAQRAASSLEAEGQMLEIPASAIAEVEALHHRMRFVLAAIDLSALLISPDCHTWSPDILQRVAVVFEGIYSIHSGLLSKLYDLVVKGRDSNAAHSHCLIQAKQLLQMLLVSAKDTAIVLNNYSNYTFSSYRQGGDLPGSLDTSHKIILAAVLQFIFKADKLIRYLFRTTSGHLQFCERLGSVYLCAKHHPLEGYSPILSSGLAAPEAKFNISFYLFIPPFHMFQPHCEDEEAASCFVHLLSRIPETGDINLIDLISFPPAKLDSYTLAAHLVYSRSVAPHSSDGAGLRLFDSVFLRISVVTYAYEHDGASRLNNSSNLSSTNGPPASLKRTLQRVEIDSSSLSPGWHKVAIEVEQVTAQVQNVSNLDHLFDGKRPGGSKANSVSAPLNVVNETTAVSLTLNGNQHAAAEVSGGRWPLYQCLLIGKLPLNMGVRPSRGEGKVEDVIVADVLWTPSLVEGMKHKSMGKKGESDESQTDSTMDTNAGSNGVGLSGPFAAANSLPCSQIISLLTVCNSCITSTLSTLYHIPCSTSTYKAVIGNQLPAFIQLLLSMIVVGNSTTQQISLHLWKQLLTLWPEIMTEALMTYYYANLSEVSGESGEVPASPRRSQEAVLRTVVSPFSPVGSAVQAALQNKVNTFTQQSVQLMLHIIASFLHTLPPPSSSSGSKVEEPGDDAGQSSFAALRRQWQRRVYFNRVALGSHANISQWMPIIAIDENVLYIEIVQIFNLLYRKFHDAQCLGMLHRTMQHLMLGSRVDGEDGSASGLPAATFQVHDTIMNLIFYANCGGWFPLVLCGGRMYNIPRRPLMYYSSCNANSHILNSISGTSSHALHGVSDINYIDILKKPFNNPCTVMNFIDNMNHNVNIHQIYNNTNVMYDLTSFEHISRNNLVPLNNVYITHIDRTSHNLILDCSSSSCPYIVPRANALSLLQSELVYMADSVPYLSDRDLLVKLWKEAHSPSLGLPPADAKNVSASASSAVISASASGGSARTSPSSFPLIEVDNRSVLTSREIQDVLRSVITLNKRMEEGGNIYQLGSKPTKSKRSKSLLEEDASSNAQMDAASGIARSGEEDANPLQQLMMQVSQLRCLSVLFGQVMSLPSTEQQLLSMRQLVEMIQSELTNILSLAMLDPIETASTIFMSSNFKGVQVDVLRNLLRESDVLFLEKLSSKCFKQFNIYSQAHFNSTFVGYPNALIQITPLAGEVLVVDNKIKAVSHFPSVKLSNVSLKTQTGRWYYEVTLLSDGLMQIGWANSSFKCDPICGQGVGDHLQSWAFDGLRMKRWNVSCEPYGRRWKAGDTVGVLVDMDLLEMRFYLNGESLGAAFEDFIPLDLFPALSLNVRQSVRLNFGQHKFLHPPDQVDCKPFRSILQAVQGATKATRTSSSPTLRKDACVASSSGAAAAKKTVSTASEGIGGNNGSTGYGNAAEETTGARSAEGSTDHAQVQASQVTGLTNNAAAAAPTSLHAANALEAVGGIAVAATDLPSILPRSLTGTPSPTPTLSPGLSSALLPTIDGDNPSTALPGNNRGNAIASDLAQGVRGDASHSSTSDNNNIGDSHPVPSRARSTLREEEEEDANEGHGGHREYLMDERWQDLETRMRMEAEDGQDDDFDLEAGRGESEEEEDEDGDEDEEEEEEEEEEEVDERTRVARHRSRARSHAERDEEEEEEEEEEEDEEEERDIEGGSARDAVSDLNTSANGGAAGAHMIELRRQAMVESLIGMGFPVDWALRAAEHCDSSTSESAAISWIIERMEIEQTNLNDLEQDSSSRAADGEDFEDLENSDIGYYIQRHAPVGHGLLGLSSSANAHGMNNSRPIASDTDRSRAINRRLVAEHMAELLESANLGFANVNMAMSRGSPAREETFGFRRNSNSAALGMMLRGEEGTGYSSFLSNKASVKKASSKAAEQGAAGDLFGAAGKDMDGFDLTFSDAAVWNNEPIYMPVLPGVYASKRRHDGDKQEVLAQVVELEAMDMISIVGTCEFALCIHYARCILLRVLQCVRMAYQRQRRYAILPPPSSVLHYGSTASPLQEVVLLLSPDILTTLLRNIFKQHITLLPQSDRVFPLLTYGTLQGDVNHRLPAFAPFLPMNRALFSDMLRTLDLVYYRDAMTSVTTEDSSLQGLAEIAFFIRLLADNACSTGGNNANPGGASQTAGGLPDPLSSAPAISPTNPATEAKSSISSSLCGLQGRLLSKVGIHSLPGAGTGGTEGADGDNFEDYQLLFACNDMLGELIEYCLNNMERALSNRYEGHDWIAGSLQRGNSNIEASKGQLSAPDSLDSSSSPYILFSYYVLRLVIVHAMEFSWEKCLSATANSPAGTDPTMLSASLAAASAGSPVLHMLLGQEDRFFHKKSPLYVLVSPDTLAKLLKLSSSLNDSLRFCAHDLAALILSIVNLNLLRLSYAILNTRAAAIATTSMAASSDSPGPAPGFASADKPGYARPTESSDTLRFQTPVPQLIAAEYYISVAKEKRLLHLLGARMKIETLEKAMYTRYTRSIAALLFQWNLLRRHLNLSITIHPYLRWYWMQSFAIPTGRLQVQQDELPYRHQQYLKVVQCSSTSIVVHWQLTHWSTDAMYSEGMHQNIPASGELEDLDNYHLFLSAQSQANVEYPVLVCSNIEPSGVYRIDDLDPDTLYEVSIHRDQYAPPGQGPNSISTMHLMTIMNMMLESSSATTTIATTAATAIEAGKGAPKSEVDPATSGLSFKRSPPVGFPTTSLSESGTQASLHCSKLSVLVSTEAEATFGFQSDSISPNVVVSSTNPLTLRNQANKKWSTARANVRLTSGLHRWDVHIDRCVSKNIFVGVATRDARLDNYVGCDGHGWAFLANRAVWHNKAKSKSYGDLFRSGDTVTVILDLDIGTLSFCLNDRPLGVAVEGLTGPLYPAFSLYNEDDQITVAQVRSVQDSPTNYGSFAAEMVLDRMDMLRGWMQYFIACHHAGALASSAAPSCIGTNAAATAKPSLSWMPEEQRWLQSLLSDDLAEECWMRYHLWLHDVVVRSFYSPGGGSSASTTGGSSGSGGGILFVHVHSRVCQEFSNGVLHVGMNVILEGRKVQVIGVGNHRIWFRHALDGELVGLTTDSLESAIEKGSLRLIHSAEAEGEQSMHDCGLHVVHAMRSHRFPTRVETTSSFLRAQDLLLLHDARAMHRVLSEMMIQWTQQDDQRLVDMLLMLSGLLSCDPFAIGVDSLLSACHSPDILAIPFVQQILEKFSPGQLAVRMHILNCLNDALLPLLPLVAPFSSCLEGPEAAVNHPSYLLVQLRPILYPQVRQQLMAVIASHTHRTQQDVLPTIHERLRSALQNFQPATPSVGQAVLGGQSAVTTPVAGSVMGEGGSVKTASGTVNSNAAADSGLLVPVDPSPTFIASTPHRGGAGTSHAESSNGASPGNIPGTAAISTTTGTISTTTGTVQGSVTPSQLTPHQSASRTGPAGLGSAFPFPLPALTTSTASTLPAIALVAPTLPTPLSGTTASPPQPTSSMLRFHVEDSADVLQKIVAAVLRDGIDRQELLQPHWVLSTWYQTTFLGQLVRFLELLQVNYSNEVLLQLREQRLNQASHLNNLHYHKQKDPALWEQALRCSDPCPGPLQTWSAFSSTIPHLALSTQERSGTWMHGQGYHHKTISLPFSLHSMPISLPTTASSSFPAMDTWASLWMSQDAMLNGLVAACRGQRLPLCLSIVESMHTEELASSRLVSDWTLFLIFVEDVSAQVELLLHSVYPYPDEKTPRSGWDWQEEAADLDSVEHALQHRWEACAMALFLQYMHAVGIFLGLCLRTGIGAFLSFPHPLFVDLITNSIASTASEVQDHPCTTTAALAIRFGLCSIYPEACLDLHSRREVCLALRQGLHPQCTLLHRLRTCATYTPPLQASDYTVECFWLCVYDLSLEHCRILVQAVGLDLRSLSSLCVTEATSDDERMEIVVDREHHVLSLPRYSHLAAMQVAVHRLVESYVPVPTAGAK